MTRFLAVLTLRNEGAFLLEWLAHHRAVGFTDFLIFSNDCDDGTDAMLDRLAHMGQITHIANPAPHPRGPQWEALRRASAHPLFATADWAMVLDIDEFVNIHAGDHSLPALIAHLPDATAIALVWRFFGNAGVIRYEDRPVTELFTRAAPRKVIWPWRASMFKTLFRTDGAYRKLGVHRPRAPEPARIAQARWFDSAGQALDASFRKQGLFAPPGQDHYALAQLNHYALGAIESYLLKIDRGRANREDGPLGMDYWVERNWCDVEDQTISALAPARAREQAALMADPELARLHHAAVAWRHRRIDALMRDDGMRALFGRLVITPPARVLDPVLARHIYRYARKAQGRAP